MRAWSVAIESCEHDGKMGVFECGLVYENVEGNMYFLSEVGVSEDVLLPCRYALVSLQGASAYVYEGERARWLVGNTMRCVGRMVVCEEEK